VTKEEFIGRAADAILRAGGFDPDKAHLGLKRLPAPATDSTMEMLAVGERLKAIEKATAALEAVAAWTAWCRLEEIRDEHRATANGDYCRACDDFEGPNYPCETRRIAEAHVGAN
jgi:hypothetical protein